MMMMMMMVMMMMMMMMMLMFLNISPEMCNQVGGSHQATAEIFHQLIALGGVMALKILKWADDQSFGLWKSQDLDLDNMGRRFFQISGWKS